MLLDENPLIELTDEDATNLVRLLCASVKKAVGERIVPATDNRKQHYPKAQKVCNFSYISFLFCSNTFLYLFHIASSKYVLCTIVESTIQLVLYQNIHFLYNQVLLRK